MRSIEVYRPNKIKLMIFLSLLVRSLTSSAALPCDGFLSNMNRPKLTLVSGLGPTGFYRFDVDPSNQAPPAVENTYVVGEERWPIDGPQAHYEDEFPDLFKKRKSVGVFSTFSDFLVHRRLSGSSTHVLDLMGSGYFLPDPKIADSITGLRLKSLKLTQSEIETFGTRPEVLGNILDESSWLKLRKSMNDRQIPNFDLEVMSPGYGWKAIRFLNETEQIEKLIELFSRSLSVLDSNGEFYFSIPLSSTVSFPGLDKFAALKLEMLKANFNLELHLGYFGLGARAVSPTPTLYGSITPHR